MASPIKVTTVSWYESDDMRVRLVVKWLSRKLEFLDWEHEDNNLSRNFSDCYSITSLLKEIYELGLKWEKIEFEDIEDNDIFSDNYY